MDDYKNRTYLSSNEVAKYLGISSSSIHDLVQKKILSSFISNSGQYRFKIEEVKKIKNQFFLLKKEKNIQKNFSIQINKTEQKLFMKDSRKMSDIQDESIHLIITSPPYFNAKMYEEEKNINNLGNIHDISKWFHEIKKIWKECFRILQNGRKIFINIMNLPIRTSDNSFRTLNLAGKTIDVCEEIGFIFKRDIIWQKTNAVKSHFGTYPYPGGILINNMHEFILEFNKPKNDSSSKYKHLTKEQKERSKLDKEFWISIKKSDVWKMSPQYSDDKRKHIAPFPYILPYRLIKAFSFIGETILDPFIGSGTTLLAAADLERNGIGYEISSGIMYEAQEILKNYQFKLL